MLKIQCDNCLIDFDAEKGSHCPDCKTDQSEAINKYFGVSPNLEPLSIPRARRVRRDQWGFRETAVDNRETLVDASTVTWTTSDVSSGTYTIQTGREGMEQVDNILRSSVGEWHISPDGRQANRINPEATETPFIGFNQVSNPGDVGSTWQIGDIRYRRVETRPVYDQDGSLIAYEDATGSLHTEANPILAEYINPHLVDGQEIRPDPNIDIPYQEDGLMPF